jgi:hypothetical protein
MTKKQVLKLLILIESVYTNCTFKDETVQQWFSVCSEMDYEKVIEKLNNHIRKSPFPPAIAEIAVFSSEEDQLQDTLQEWIEEGRERIERQRNNTNPITLPDWLIEYSTRKSI